MKKLQRLELLKDFVQEAVDRGATSVESIHQYIADLPFEALEVTGLLDRDKSVLRARHQRSIGMVYGAIRRINREIGQLISDQFENVDEAKSVDDIFAANFEPDPAAPTPASKPIPAKKAAACKPARPVARKIAVKKTVVKKTAAKKAAAKKTVAKKIAVKKAAAKKVAPRKAVAKQAVAKKASVGKKAAVASGKKAPTKKR